MYQYVYLGVQKEAGQRLTEFCQETHWSQQTPFSNNKRDNLYPWTWPNSQYQNQLIIFFAAKDGEALYSQKKRLGPDCGSDHELLIAKFRLKLRKIGKTTWPFWYDLNEIPYDYTVEMMNRFKGLDLVNRMPE